MSNLSDRIRNLRKKHGMTQEELGAILGIQKATIQKYEKGTVVNLKPETVEKMAEAFGVSPAYIMGWDKMDERLPDEVSYIEQTKDLFGFLGIELYRVLHDMNDEGLRKVLFYAEDIKDNYRKKAN